MNKVEDLKEKFVEFLENADLSDVQEWTYEDIYNDDGIRDIVSNFFNVATNAAGDILANTKAGTILHEACYKFFQKMGKPEWEYIADINHFGIYRI